MNHAIHFIFRFTSNQVTFNPKNKGRRLHRRPGFVDWLLTLQNCPKPIDEDERRYKKKEDEIIYMEGYCQYLFPLERIMTTLRAPEGVTSKTIEQTSEGRAE